MIKNKNDKINFAIKLSISFFIPALILFIAYSIFGMFPFGEKSILIMDMSNQYVEFFNGLKSIFSGETTPYFSWHKSFGTNYIGVFAYYVSSPFSFLTLFFFNSLMPIALYIINILKVGLCGLTFYLFIKSKFNFSFTTSLIFSSAYALMSYNIVYSMSLMWLDGVIWLPIILIGIDKLIKNGKFSLLTVSFAVLFFSNYYISFMVAIGAGIYLVLSYFTTDNKQTLLGFSKCIGKFILSGIIAASFCAFLLLPTLFSLTEGKLVEAAKQMSKVFYFNLIDIFPKIIPGVYDSITNSGAPNIFCSTLMLIGTMLFFFNKKIKIKEKIMSFSILVLLITSMWIIKLDCIWHVFQMTNWFPFRYSFICSFFLIYICARCLLKKDGIKLWHFLTSLSMFLLISIFIYFYNYKIVGLINIITFVIVILLTFTVIYLIAFKKIKKSHITSVFLLAICLIELGINAYGCIKGLDNQFHYTKYNDYTKNYDKVSTLVETAKKSETDFFRLEKNTRRSMNESIAFGYNGIEHYSSSYNKDINNITKKLGMAQYHFWNSYYGSSPITDSLFNVKYVISNRQLPSLFKQIQNKDNYILYKNENTLNLCYLANKKIDSFTFDNDFIKSQNKLIKYLTGNSEYNIFSQIEDVEKNLYNVKEASTIYNKTNDDNKISYSFTSTSNNPIYFNLTCGQSSSGYIKVNNKKIADTFTNNTKNTPVYIGEFKPGEKVTVDIVLQKASTTINTTDFYYFDTDLYNQAINEIKTKGNTTEISHDSSSYKATINLQDNKILMTSIPASDSWSVYLDGKKIETKEFQSTFIMADLSNYSTGEHEIYFKYTPKGFTLGLIISISAISLVIIYLIIRNARLKLKP